MADKVRDPHPSDEEHHDRHRRPGGDDAPHDDIGPNDAVHDGKAPPKPDGSHTGGQTRPGTRT